MSSLFDEKVDTLYSPAGNEFEKMWHGFQTPLQDGIALDGSNAPEAFREIVKCGIRPELDVDISESSELGIAMKDWNLIVADCRNGKAGSYLPLHVAKAGYQVHSNKSLFDAMVQSAIEVCGKDGFQITTVGTVGAYSQFLVSLAIKGHESFKIGKADEWKRFFNLNSSHNGMISSNRMLSMIRMVCFNTILASISDAETAGTISNIKHTLNSVELINPETFEKDLKTWISNADSFKNLLNACKAQPMNLDQFRTFSAGVFTQEKSDELSSNSWNRIKELEIAFQRGDGNYGESRYDAINAFTQFFSRDGAGSKNVSSGKRLASANFGRGNDWKREAIRVASNEEIFTETVKRGEILYSDKSKVEALKN